jgi:hypothetical protein
MASLCGRPAIRSSVAALPDETLEAARSRASSAKCFMRNTSCSSAAPMSDIQAIRGFDHCCGEFLRISALPGKTYIYAMCHFLTVSVGLKRSE